MDGKLIFITLNYCPNFGEYFTSNPIPNVRYDVVKENNPGGTTITHPDIPRQPSAKEAVQDVLLNITRELTRMRQ